jgi:DNA polymerase V
MREELEVVEEYSVDEAFFAVDGNPEEVAKRVKKAVETRVGIPVSVGIARTKTLAKLASRQAKKGSGVFHLTDQCWSDLQVTTPLQSIWGVGGQSEMAYKKHNLLTAHDLLQADSGRIKSIFGVSGTRLQSELRGESVLLLNQARTDQKSLMSSQSFCKETKDKSVIKDAVAYHVRQSLQSLRRRNLKTGAIRVHIQTSRHGDFLLRGGSKEAVLNSPTNDNHELLDLANGLVDELFEDGVPYKKAGITLHHLIPIQVVQGVLFVEPGTTKQSWRELNSLIDTLNKKTKGAVLLGSRLREGEWQAKKDSRSPAYTTAWTDLVEVKA